VRRIRTFDSFVVRLTLSPAIRSGCGRLLHCLNVVFFFGCWVAKGSILQLHDSMSHKALMTLTIANIKDNFLLRYEDFPSLIWMLHFMADMAFDRYFAVLRVLM
jgi:hypothetical protein